MRRLTLILSDLYLPEEAAASATVPQALDLPNLDWLLRFAGRARTHRATGAPGSRAELGAADLAMSPWRSVCAPSDRGRRARRRAWLATPVHLEARLDHVRLADRGLLRLGADGARGLAARSSRAPSARSTRCTTAASAAFLLSGVVRGRSRHRRSGAPARRRHRAARLPRARGRRAAASRRRDRDVAARRAAQRRARTRAASRACRRCGCGAAAPPVPVTSPCPDAAATMHAGVLRRRSLARGADRATSERPRPRPPAGGFAALSSRAMITRSSSNSRRMTGRTSASRWRALERNWFAPRARRR